jgi:hypothetical protein
MQSPRSNKLKQLIDLKKKMKKRSQRKGKQREEEGTHDPHENELVLLKVRVQ